MYCDFILFLLTSYQEIAELPPYLVVNPEGLLYCVFRSQGRSHNLFSDFHISEDALEHDGLIVTVELLNELPSHFNSVIFLKKYINSTCTLQCTCISTLHKLYNNYYV